MSEQFIRKSRITVDTTVFNLFGADDARDDQSLRVRFDVIDCSLQTPRVAIVRVTNMADINAQKMLNKVGKTLTIEAGYRDSMSQIFKGDIKQTRIGKENPTDTYVAVYASTQERAYNHAVVNKTLPAGSTNRDIYKACLDAMKPFGVTEGHVPPILDQTKFPRPVTLFGQARTFLRTIALTNNCTWNIRENALDMLPADEALPGGAFVLNSHTGLIGMPVQTEMGILAQCLINPKIGINSLVRINQKSIQSAAPQLGYMTEAYNQEPYLPSLSTDGIYKVCGLSHVGDTRGQPWYCELTLIRAGGNLNKAQLAAGFGIGFN